MEGRESIHVWGAGVNTEHKKWGTNRMKTKWRTYIESASRHAESYNHQSKVWDCFVGGQGDVSSNIASTIEYARMPLANLLGRVITTTSSSPSRSWSLLPSYCAGPLKIVEMKVGHCEPADWDPRRAGSPIIEDGAGTGTGGFSEPENHPNG